MQHVQQFEGISVNKSMRVWGWLSGAVLLLSLGGCGARSSGHLDACRILVHSQGISTSAARLWGGEAVASSGLQTHSEALTALLDAPKKPLSPELMDSLRQLQKQADLLLEGQRLLMDYHQDVRTVLRQSNELLEAIEKLQPLILAEGKASEIQVVSLLAMLSQRMGLSASEIMSYDGASPEGVFLLGKDTNTFRDLLTALRDGDAELRVRAVKTGAAQDRLKEVAAQYEVARAPLGRMLSSLQGLLAFKDSQSLIARHAQRIHEQLMPQCMRD